MNCLKGTIIDLLYTKRLLILFISIFLICEGNAQVPTINSFSPTAAYADDTITIKGKDFTGATGVRFGFVDDMYFTVAAKSFSIVSDSVIIAVVDSCRSGGVAVINASGTAKLSGFIYYYAPTISGFTPTTGGGGAVVTITGRSFTKATAVKFGSINARSFTVVSSTTITAVVANGESGNISVTDPKGTGTSSGIFTYVIIPPVIDTAYPLSGKAGESVTIVGNNFMNVTSVTFGKVPASSFKIVSVDTIIAVIGGGNSGNIEVTNSAGKTTYTGFTYTGPYITSFSADTTSLGDNIIKIFGYNFTDVTLVSFGGLPATYFTVVSPSFIIAKPGAGRSGDVFVKTKQGSIAYPGFIYSPTPTITSFTPTTSLSGGVINITGTNFVNVLSVKCGDVACGFTVNSAYNITATLSNGASGKVSVQTTTGIAYLGGFTYIPKPTIASLNPAIGISGSVITITGTNFTSATVVKFGTKAAASFNVVSATTITAVVGEGESGYVTVVTPGGAATLFSGFVYNVLPEITSVMPDSGVYSERIIIHGKNFIGTTSVKFGGIAARSFSVVSSDLIAAFVGNGASGNITVTTNTGTAQFAGFKYLGAPIPYCYPSTSSSGYGSFGINRVQFSDLDKTSANNSTLYSNYTFVVLPATVNRGNTYPIAVTGLINGSFEFSGSAGVWLDYNHNNVFESNEYLRLDRLYSFGYYPPAGSTQIYNGSITIPANAPSGITKMRIRLVNNYLDSIPPCTVYSMGETEDYNILISDIAISYTHNFSDTILNPTLTLSANIKQDSLVGINTTDSLKPRLWAKEYNSLTWKSFKGNLISGTNLDGNWQFTINHDSLGITKNISDSVQFYFAAQNNNVPANVNYLPTFGAFHLNVATQISAPSSPFFYRLNPHVRDTVYINQSSTGFSSLSMEGGLFQYINNNKIEKDLVAVVETDLQETGKYDLKQSGLNGHSVKIVPDKAIVHTIIPYSLMPNSMIKFNGASNITIDGSFNGEGKYFKLRNYSSTTTNDSSENSIQIYNSCQNIALKNLILEYTYASPDYTFEDSTDCSILIKYGTNTNILIERNIFQSSNVNNMATRYVTSILGTNSITVRGNEFSNFMHTGVFLGYGNQYCTIDSNHFYRSYTPATGNTYLINDFIPIYTSGGGHKILNNYIGGQAPYCLGSALLFKNLLPTGVLGIKVANGIANDSAVVIANNVIDNFLMDGNNLTYSNAFVGISTYFNKVIIENNRIGNPNSTSPSINTYAGSLVNGIGAGFFQNALIKNNIVTSISNNNSGCQLTGIGCSNSSNGSIVKAGNYAIIKNKVFNLLNQSGIYSGNTWGIVTNGGINDLIEQNVINDLQCGHNSVNGISYGGVNNPVVQSFVKVQRNKIFNLVNTSTVEGACNCGNGITDDYNGKINGITVTGESYTTKNYIEVLNNQITLTNNNIENPVSIRGIDVITYDTTEQRFMYNTVYIGGKASKSGGSAAFSTNVLKVGRIQNNIFYNERSGGITGHYGQRNTNDLHLATFFNNSKGDNNLYVLKDTSKFALWSYSNYVSYNFANWRNLTKLDSNSYLIPSLNILSSQFFIDKENGNLNINTAKEICWFANSKAIPIPGITADYDSANIRSQSLQDGYTDIGADEFNTNTIAPIKSCMGGDVIFTSNFKGSVYQWQSSTDGFNFSNISNNINYSGVNTDTLYVNNVSAALNGLQYRCLVEGKIGDVSSIKFSDTWIGTINADWGNPANWSCNVIPDANTNVIINKGTVIVNANGVCKSLTISENVNFTVNPGVTLTITQ